MEVRRRAQRPLLDDDHVETGIGQDLRGDATAGTAADDDDIGVDGPFAGQGCGIDVLPAGSDSFADRITHHFTSGGPG